MTRDVSWNDEDDGLATIVPQEQGVQTVGICHEDYGMKQSFGGKEKGLFPDLSGLTVLAPTV